MTRAEQIDTLLKKNPQMKAREISETLGLSRSTVYNHLGRMRKRGRATAVAARRSVASRTVEPVSLVDRIASEIGGEIAVTEDYLARLRSAHSALV